jgi:uncharacterized membrane protein
MKKRLLVFVTLICILLGIGSVSAATSFTVSTESAVKETCPTVFTVYQFTVSNTGDEIDTYTVSKSGSAASWALISPPGFVLQPGNSQSVFVYVTPSRNAQTGNYALDISVTADKADTKTSTVSLNVGDCHSLSISPQQTEKEICTGESTSYSFTIQNNGLWSENIKLSLAGSAAQWSSLSEEFLRLENGESKTITIFTEPRANEIGDFDLSVTARSLESNALVGQEFSLKVNGCYGVSLSANENFASFCENSEVKVPLTVRNSGTAPNTYNIKISGADWTALDKTSVSLNAGTQQTINAILFPGYDIQGKFPITIVAESAFGEEDSEVIVTANVLKCHSVSVSISETEDNICPRTSKTYSAEITNAGTKAEQFSLKLLGPNWVKLDKSSVNLGASETQTVNIVAEPSADTFAGKSTITLEVASQEGSKVSDKDSITIEIAPKDSCFGVRTTPETNNVKVAYGEGTLIPIVVENIGSETETFSLDVSGNGASFAQLNPSSIEINGNSAETVYLYIAVPDKTEKESYSVTVAARDEVGVVSSSNTIYISLTDEPTLPIVEPAQDEEPEVSSLISVLREQVASMSESLSSEVTSISGSLSSDIEPSDYAEQVSEYKYWIIGVIIFIILVIFAMSRNKSDKKPKEKEQKKGLWKKFTDWLEDEDVEEIELIDEYEPKEKEQKKGLWKKFTNWLEEEDEDLKELYKDTGAEAKKETKAKPKITPKSKINSAPNKSNDLLGLAELRSARKKKSEKGLFQKFTDWLDEDIESIQKKKEKPIKIVKPKPKTKQINKKDKKGLFQKFTDWLDEEDEITETVGKVAEKQSKPTLKTKKTPKKDSLFKKFSAWLDEEDVEPKVTKPKEKKVKIVKKKEKKSVPNKTNKNKSFFKKFTDWLDEEDIDEPIKTVEITKSEKKQSKPAKKIKKKSNNKKEKQKPKQKKNEKSSVDKFKDWLDEE